MESVDSQEQKPYPTLLVSALAQCSGDIPGCHPKTPKQRKAPHFVPRTLTLECSGVVPLPTKPRPNLYTLDKASMDLSLAGGSCSELGRACVYRSCISVPYLGSLTWQLLSATW